MTQSPSFLSDPPSSPEVTAAHEADISSDGYVANLTRIWCWRPDVQAAFRAVRASLTGESTLSQREVAVMVVASAAARGDSYCSYAWGRNLAELSDEATAVNVINGETAGLSEREAALQEWARHVVRDPNSTTEGDVDRLRRAGFSDREIFEATAWIAFRLAFATVNDALGARPDAQLAEEAPRLVRDAVSYGRRPPTAE